MNAGRPGTAERVEKSGGVTLFRQTFLVLVGALFLAHLAGFFVIILLPQGDSGAATLSGIANQLADPTCENIVPELTRSKSLQLSRAGRPPVVPPGMQTDPLVQAQLAQVLGVPESAIRLAWFEGSEIRLSRPGKVAGHNQSNRLQETIFLREIVFARQWQDYWCTGTVPPAKWYSHWQVSMALILSLSLTVLLFPAWLFARRLSRPIGEFASAADAIGHDHKAPLLAEDGPKEMRIAARALNAMQVRIQEQLREREAMVAAIAHDLRTPLARIAFRVETASPSLSESVQRDIEQMTAMIATTLEYASESQQPRGDEQIDLVQLLNTMVVDEQAVGHEVQFNCEISALFVEGDEVQFSRLFQNLIDNAAKFGDAAEITLEQKDAMAVITIADRGPGIDPELIEEMFRPFSRGEPSRNRQTGGIGLGLSITRAIARKHGGDINLTNREGGGLQVVVTLPVLR